MSLRFIRSIVDLDPPHEALLAYAGDKLVAVLVRLSSDNYPSDLAGAWFVECAFGAAEGAAGRVFGDLDDAETILSVGPKICGASEYPKKPLGRHVH
jgi:hypothetical protein